MTGEETSHLYEFLFVLTNPIPSEAEKDSFLDSIMTDPSSEWQGPLMTQLVSDPNGWLLGATGGPPPGDQQWEQTKQVRVKSHGVLVTLLCICRRLQVSLGPLDLNI